MQSPSIEVRNGRLIEEETPPTPEVKMFWENRWVPARLVGHEEVWHAEAWHPRWQGPAVRHSSFVYGLASPVMDLLRGDPEAAAEKAYVPEHLVKSSGTDTLVVQVSSPDTGQAHARRWRTEHFDAYQQYGINATQFQTCASVLCFCELLLANHNVRREVPLCASSLPWPWFGNGELDVLWDRYGIHWEPAPPTYAVRR